MLSLLAFFACKVPAPAVEADTDTDVDADTDADVDDDGSCAAVQASIDASCVTSCHSGDEPLGELDLTDVQAAVGQPSQQAALDLIRAFDPEGSYLLHKVDGTHEQVGGEGSAMPPPGTLQELDTAAVQSLEQWIASGASCEADADADTDIDTDVDTDSDSDSDADTDTGMLDDGCTEVQDILNAACTGCHGVFAIDGLNLSNLPDVVGVSSANVAIDLIVPGDSANSYLMQKIWGTHDTVGGPGVQMPPGFIMDPADAAILADWIDAGATCILDPGVQIEPVSDPNGLDQAALFTCGGTPSSSPSRIRRLDKLEFRRRVGQDFDHATTANPFEPPGIHPYSTYSEGVSINVATLDLYFDVLSYAGEQWAGTPSYNRDQYVPRTDSQLGCLYDDASPDLACIDYFARTYLQTAAIHRAPPQDEVDRLVAYAQVVLADEAANGGSRVDSVSRITSAAWLHTSALFEFEIGQGTPDAFGRMRLSDWEAASMVGSMISDRGVGGSGVYLYDNDLSGDDRFTELAGGHLAGLATAAEDGSIQQPAVAAALLRQYAMGVDPDREDEWVDYGTHSLSQRVHRSEEWMADKLDRFFLEFFDVEGFESGFQDTPNATSPFHADLPNFHARSIDELRQYEGWNEPDGLMVFTDAVAKVVVLDQNVLQNLLTTRDFYIPATSDPATDYTNRMFNVTGSIPADRAGRWNTLPADERAGLLTHPVWLAAHGDAFEDGPSIVLRGKWMRENLLCESVPPLELVTVQAQLLPSDGTLRARDRVEQSIEVHNQCMACHQFMNSLGRTFEIYNHAGYVRADDHGFAPDGSTFLDNMPDPALDGPYDDAIDLMGALSTSPYVKRCFIRQTFRFFAGRDETLEDACVLSAMEDTYDASGGSFVGMLETLATHDTSMYRHNPDLTP